MDYDKNIPIQQYLSDYVTEKFTSLCNNLQNKISDKILLEDVK